MIHVRYYRRKYETFAASKIKQEQQQQNDFNAREQVLKSTISVAFDACRTIFDVFIANRK